MRSTRLMLILCGTGFTLAGPASAGGPAVEASCCADLEERIGELEASVAQKGSRPVSLTVSGMLNEALLIWDDGELSDVYQGTNDTAPSRFRFLGEAKLASSWSAGYLLELGLRTNRLNRTDQNTAQGFINTPAGRQDAANVFLRHSAWWVRSKDFGIVWLGLTDQATEKITEINTANTLHFLKHYGRWNGNFILRRSDTGELTTGPGGVARTWGNILPQSGQVGEGVPGEGDRFNEIRYDSPALAGFTVSASWGEDDFWDVALRYSSEVGGMKIAAGVGYADWTGTGPTNARGCSIVDPVLDASSSCSQLGASASVMHVASGLFLTGAYGIKWDDRRQRTFEVNAGATGTIDDTDEFYLVLAGVERKWLPWGKTTVYAEHERFETGAGIAGSGQTATGLPRSFGTGVGFPNPGGPAQFMSGAEIDVWGLGLNQSFENAAMDFYLAYRRADATVMTSDTGATNDAGRTAVALEPIHLIMTGVHIKF